jgi:hypothetical protein
MQAEESSRLAKGRRSNMPTNRPIGKAWSPHQSAAGGLARIGTVLGWALTGVVGAIVATVVAFAVVVLAVMGSAVLAIAAVVLGARRTTRPAKGDPDVIEARHVGGHSWVATGWQGR